MDKYFKEDIDYLIENCKYLRELDKKTVLITGSTGLIGSLLIKTILENNKVRKMNTKVIALCRNEEKFKEMYIDYLNDINLKLILSDIKDNVEIEDSIDYIIHTAAITKSKLLVDFPVETTMTAVIGTRNILEFAKEKKVSSMVYLSSMEVYGTFKESNTIDEDMLGYIDLKNVRNGYPESKRLCEYLCNAYAKEYNVNVKSIRVAQTFGAGVPIDDTRIVASIARSVINNEDIILHTKGLSEANYCYTADAIDAIFTVLINGSKGEAYNVANEECHTTISKMAQMVCKEIANDKIKVVYDIPKDISINGYAPDTKMKLSSNKIRKLGWIPKNNLLDSYKKLILSYKERMR